MRQLTIAQAGFAVLTAIAVTWTVARAQGTKELGSNGILLVDAAVLAGAVFHAVEDAPYMKVTGPAGAKYAAASSFSAKSGGFKVELAAYEPLSLALQDWPIDEFMYILEGHVQIADSHGNSRTYGPGDAIVMPKGFTGTWRSTEPLKKIAVYTDPPGQS